MTPLTWDNLYTEHADAYELIVSHEDYQNNLVAALSRIQPLAGTIAAEFGCGTGRVTGLIQPRVKHVHAFDLTGSMLRVAQEKQRRQGWDNVTLVQADSREFPARSGWADFAIEGWAFLHIAIWNGGDWQNQLSRALDEMQQVVRPAGKMILIETLGTGEREPKVPPNFREVYDWLEQERGFVPEAIRTDYRFETMGQVRDMVVPLFGERLLAVLEQTPEGIVIPECTGLWWRDAITQTPNQLYLPRKPFRGGMTDLPGA